MNNRLKGSAAFVLAATMLTTFTGCSSGNQNLTSQRNAGGVTVGGPQGKDVIRKGDGIILGSGWFPIERYRGDTFHWATNDAEVTVCPSEQNRTLAMLLEPGPGINGSPTPQASLTVTGNYGDSATTTIKGRQYVKVSVADHIPAETFLIHAKTINHPSPNGDQRILNFRVLDAVVGSSISDCKNDIVRDGSLILGNGWYGFETYNGESFRWVNTGAQIRIVAAQNKPFTIEADVEPGPSLGGTPLQISLKNASGKTIAHNIPVTSREYITFAVPAEPTGTVFTLNVQSKDAPVPRDPRKLNFRVFDIKIKPSS